MAESNADATWFRSTFEAIENEIGKVIVGQKEVVRGTLMAMAANGHVLLEGMPGLGKTLLVRSLSRCLDMDFSRIQFTPDMMPADVTGTNVLAHDEGARRFEFRKGPIFANLVLADEINRATPKTQSAMLEAMQELAVTVGGVRHALREPFLVLATQNPIEQEGTYPLPEAQLDRFLFKLLVPFPTRAELLGVVQRTTGTTVEEVAKVGSGDDLLRMRQTTREVVVADPVAEYAVSIVLATHPDLDTACPQASSYARFGASPRGAQALVLAGKVLALVKGRYNVSKEDVKAMARPALRHRIGLNYQAEADGVTADQLVDAAVAHADAQDRDPVKV